MGIKKKFAFFDTWKLFLLEKSYYFDSGFSHIQKDLPMLINNAENCLTSYA